MRGWTEALDAFEARLAEQRAALDGGEAGEVAPFAPPGGLGPLPPSLLERANALAGEAADLVQELTGNVVALRQDLAVVDTVGASTGRASGARLIDTSA